MIILSLRRFIPQKLHCNCQNW